MVIRISERLQSTQTSSHLLLCTSTSRHYYAHEWDRDVCLAGVWFGVAILAFRVMTLLYPKQSAYDSEKSLDACLGLPYVVRSIVCYWFVMPSRPATLPGQRDEPWIVSYLDNKWSTKGRVDWSSQSLYNYLTGPQLRPKCQDDSRELRMERNFSATIHNADLHLYESMKNSQIISAAIL
jgi:hypothetical protein